MKKLIEEIKVEILFWVSILITFTMISNIHVMINTIKNDKRFLKDIIRIQLKAKTQQEYWKLVEKTFPELYEESNTTEM